MNHIGLFEGIGGFSLAARWMDWNTIAWCEWNEFGQKVLKHHFPNAKPHGDITKTDFTIYRGQCDILTGGFPCQPYSSAGKRLGKEDERHLWPEMLRAIREIQPGYVVGENVRGLTNWNGGVVFDEVQADLEAEGYEVLPFLLPACAVNAPHRRDRIWFVAYSNKSRNKEPELQQPNIHTGSSRNNEQITTHPGQTEHPRRYEPTQGQQYDGGRDARSEFAPFGGSLDATNTNQERFQRGAEFGSIGGSRENGDKQPAGCFRTNWQQFPTQSPVCSRNDGISDGLVGITFSKHREKSIGAYGNAIVPQVALMIFKAIQEYENLQL